MRGLTVFVQDVRNCSNKVRIDLDLDDATRATRMNESFIHSFILFVFDSGVRELCGGRENDESLDGFCLAGNVNVVVVVKDGGLQRDVQKEGEKTD